MRKKKDVAEYYDHVKHKNNDMTGVVIAIYQRDDVTVFDVKGDDEKIYYKTPAANWTFVKEEHDNE